MQYTYIVGKHKVYFYILFRSFIPSNAEDLDI